MTERSEDFKRVGDLLGDVCEAAAEQSRSDHSQATRPAAGKSSNDTARDLATVWPEVAGAEVAANAVPVQLRAGRLVVSTSSSVWAHTLQYMGEDLVGRLNKRLGPGSVKEIVFRHAGWEERRTVERAEHTAVESRVPAGMLTPEQSEAIARLDDLDLPIAIRESVGRAMRAAFERDQHRPVR